MITNLFYQKSEVIGLNFERVKGGFVVCVAFKSGSKWKAKSLSGISGDLDDNELIDKVISTGQSLDETTASMIFSKAKELGLEYSF